MKIVPHQKQGYELMHRGLLALSRVEANGIRIDVRKLEATEEDLTLRLRDLRKKLTDDPVWKMWRKRFGEKANLLSGPQTAEIFYKQLGFKPTDFTDSGAASTDEEALQKIDHPFIPDLVRVKKYDKALGTFLRGIKKETVDGFLHPFFNLHTVQSYRSSSDNPNFQNFPVRDKEIAQIIRSLFIPRKGCTLVENDFKGVEVNVSACYHHDQNFISYITTPGKDMHRDMAAQIYMLKPNEVSKEARYGAKNKFVFPQFYGDYYVACARNLWDWITKGNLTGPGGIPLMDHLRQRGIKRLGDCDPEREPERGTFEAHLKEVEDDFWNNRFQAYGQWRRDWYQAYLKNGYFDLHTGFRIHGTLRRNQVNNFAVQGSAFHCLLQTLIWTQDNIDKYKFGGKIVGQIHDSLIGDIPTHELSDYLSEVEYNATQRLRDEWKWLIVPLEIEYEIAPSDGSWHDKREVKFKLGRFQHPSNPDLSTTDSEKFMAALNQSKK